MLGSGYGAELAYDLPLGGAIVSAYVGIDLSSAESCGDEGASLFEAPRKPWHGFRASQISLIHE